MKKLLNDEVYYKKVSDGCKSVFNDTMGTTKKIIENIIE